MLLATVTVDLVLLAVCVMVAGTMHRVYLNRRREAKDRQTRYALQCDLITTRALLAEARAQLKRRYDTDTDEDGVKNM